MQSGLPKSANASSGIECPSRNLKVRRTGREHDWMGGAGEGREGGKGEARGRCWGGDDKRRGDGQGGGERGWFRKGRVG